MVRAMYAAGFAGYGHQVCEAANLQQAIQLFESGIHPSVVIADLHLTDGEGQDVIQAIHAYFGDDPIRVIVTTSDTEPNIEGADFVVPKPYDIVEMVQLV